MDVAKAGAERPQMEKIPAGALLTISSGEYSSYSISGVFRAKAVIDPELLRYEWLQKHPDQEQDYQFSESEFLGWVARRGLIEPVECYEWHLCDYSRVSEMHVSVMSNDDATT